MKTFKTQIYMNSLTEQYCRRAFGVRRTVWNWTLAQFLETKKLTNQLPSNYTTDKIYRANCTNKANKTFEWLVSQMVSARAMQETMKDIKAAFALARTQGKKLHKKGLKPSFKTRKDRLQTFSYYHSNDSVFKFESEHSLSFECGSRQQRGVVHTRESLAFLQKPSVKLCRMTITCQAGKYWLAISYEKPNRKVAKPAAGSKAGIDLGVVVSAALFDGQQYQEFSFNTKKSLKSDRLAKQNDRELSRKHEGSKRYEKLLLLKQRRSLRAALQRKAQLENTTADLVRRYAEIVIDDFNFKGTLGLKHQCKRDKLYRCMVAEFKTRLEQKAQVYGTIVRYVPHHKGVKTTHRCSNCGSSAVYVDRNTRILHCKTCGHTINRDHNAAINTFAL